MNCMCVYIYMYSIYICIHIHRLSWYHVFLVFECVGVGVKPKNYNMSGSALQVVH